MADVSDFWDPDGEPLGPPLDAALLQRCECRLGVRLPQAFVDLYKVQNGGMPNEWLDFFEPFLPLSLDGEGIRALSEFDEEEVEASLLAELESSFGDLSLIVPLCLDDHLCHALNFNRRGPQADPEVIFIDFECQDFERVAESFDGWLETLTDVDLAPAIDWDESDGSQLIVEESFEEQFPGGTRRLEQRLSERGSRLVMLRRITSGNRLILERAVFPKKLRREAAEILDFPDSRVERPTVYLLQMQPAHSEAIEWITCHRTRHGWKNRESCGAPWIVPFESPDRDKLIAIRDRLFGEETSASQQVPEELRPLIEQIRQLKQQFQSQGPPGSLDEELPGMSDFVQRVLDAFETPNPRIQRDHEGASSEEPGGDEMWEGEEPFELDELLETGFDDELFDEFDAEWEEEGCDEPGRSALHIACEMENLVAVRMLLRSGADPNQTDEFDETPLNVALDRANPEIVTHLIQAGANLNGLDPGELIRTTRCRYKARLRAQLKIVRQAGGASPADRNQLEELEAELRSAEDAESRAIMELPDTITLEPCRKPVWREPERIEIEFQRLARDGFEPVGDFLLLEFGVPLRAFVHRGQGAYAIVYEHPLAGPGVDLVRYYANGRRRTFTTLAFGAELESPPFAEMVRVFGRGSDGLLVEFHSQRGHEPLGEVSAEQFRGDFTRDYAREVAWRKAHLPT